jgi:hypothetical protein
MLHEFITACRQHHAAHSAEGLRFLQAKHTHLGQQGMRGQLDESHTDCPISNEGINEVNKVTNLMKKSKNYDQKLNRDARNFSDDEPRPFPLNICKAASTEERNLQESSMLRTRNNTAGANLSLLEINALQQRITSTECFYQQLRNAFTALQIKVEANLRVLEARVNALERDRHIHHKKWPQNAVDCEPQCQQLSTLTISSNPLFQPVDKPLPSVPKIDICPGQAHPPSNKIAANLKAALEQAKNTLTELHCHLA